MKKLVLFGVAFCLMATFPVGAQTMLSAPWFANSGQAGVMFDIRALHPLEINSFQHNLDLGTWDIEIYAHTAPGSYVGDEGDPSAWTLIHSESGFVGAGINTQGGLSVLAASYHINVGDIQGFYVTCTNGAGMNYQIGSGVGNVSAADGNAEILEGHGMCYPFSCLFGPRRYSGAVGYTPDVLPTIDMALSSIDSPTGGSSTACGHPLQTETVTITVQNMGSNPVFAGTLIPVSYVLEDGVNPPTTVSEILVPLVDILSFQSITYSFSALAGLGSSHVWLLVATVFLSGDAVAGNDSVTTTVANGISSAVSIFPWVDNLDTAGPDGSTVAPVGWTNSQTDNAGDGSYPDWIARSSASTPSGGTGPISGDHTSGSGFYIHVEDSGTDTVGDISLITPCLDLNLLASPFMSFWLCSYNDGLAAEENPLEIDVIDWSSGSPVLNQSVVPPFLSELDRGWHEKSIDLSAYVGKAIQVVFRGVNNNGTYKHDVCIDDIRVYEAISPTGQPAQPGLAELDINGALNPLGDPVSSYTPGPHTVPIPSGAIANIDITGASSDQTIILLSGELNVGVGGVANIGQFDIGTPSGGPVPGGLTIVANGANTGGGSFWSSVFTTGGGTMSVAISFNVPLGTVIPLQAILFTGGPTVIALSNAVVATAI